MAMFSGTRKKKQWFDHKSQLTVITQFRKRQMIHNLQEKSGGLITKIFRLILVTSISVTSKI